MPSRCAAINARSPPSRPARFDDEIVRSAGPFARPTAGAGAPAVGHVDFAVDEGPRRDTSPEALAKLRPAFHVAGTVTAGNSSQMSDGAAAVLVMERRRAPRRSA